MANSPTLLPPHHVVDLIDVHTAVLEKHPLERGLDEAQRALATLTALLTACPGDLQPMFQVGGVCWCAPGPGVGKGAKPGEPKMP